MRLTDLRDMIANVVDYDPNVETYRTQINQLINDAYYRLFTTKVFTFAQKETIVKAYTDVDITDITLANGAHDPGWRASTPLPTESPTHYEPFPQP